MVQKPSLPWLAPNRCWNCGSVPRPVYLSPPWLDPTLHHTLSPLTSPSPLPSPTTLYPLLRPRRRGSGVKLLDLNRFQHLPSPRHGLSTPLTSGRTGPTHRPSARSHARTCVCANVREPERPTACVSAHGARAPSPDRGAGPGGGVRGQGAGSGGLTVLLFVRVLWAAHSLSVAGALVGRGAVIS